MRVSERLVHVAGPLREDAEYLLGVVGVHAVAHTQWMVAKSTSVEVPFVIGADRHRSAVRRELDIEFAEGVEAFTACGRCGTFTTINRSTESGLAK
jgi:hypothetical protein